MIDYDSFWLLVWAIEWETQKRSNLMQTLSAKEYNLLYSV